MQPETFRTMIRRIEDLLSEKLGARGPDLRTRLRRAGRRLPRNVRRAGAFLAETEARTSHPRHVHEIDDAGVARAYETMVAHLNALDPKARRRDRLMSALTSVALNALLMAGALAAWAWWRGLL